MGTISYRQKNLYLQRCNKCGKLSHYIYRISLGQFSYNFCSGLCADAARKEFQHKTKLGITPANLEPIPDLVEEELIDE